MDKEGYYQKLMDEIASISDSGGLDRASVFTELAAELLSDAGAVDTISLVSFRNKSRGVRIDGVSLDREQGLLSLFITDFHDHSSVMRMSRSEATRCFARGMKFFINSFKENYVESFDNDPKVRQLAELISSEADDYDKVKFVILTNAELSKRVGEIHGSVLNGYNVIYDIWHVGRFFNLDQAGRQREEIIIDFSQFGDGTTLACLPVKSDSDAYTSFLLAVPGVLLAQLYDQYGERLLEQNVRTFLQFRVKVNKGIRNTLKTEPEMFFAYNNGITAAADEIVLKEQNGSVNIAKVINFQIVNGGQTTVALATALRKDKVDLTKVLVQLKLSVIPPDKEDFIIPKISEYANTQNKINSADFLSNHPFHRRIEELSRQTSAPALEGALLETVWFYERTRGQFATAQLPLTLPEKKEFLKKNPKKQMFNKTDLAKFVQSWEQVPHQVSLGAQKNFAHFTEKVNELWKKEPDMFNRKYFEDLVVKAILFRTLDRLIMRQPWYGGYKANVVTYSIAKLASFLETNQKGLDFALIWKKQSLSESLTAFLLRIAQKINHTIQQTPAGVTNVTEWCKKEDCWNNVQDVIVELGEDKIAEFCNV